jgi:hypothetical protein
MAQPTDADGRDSSARRPTSRGQVSRIDRDYYHRPSLLRRARRWAVVAGLVAGVAWVAWGAIDSPRHHSPGPVAAVHARWERDCQACHEPFQPITDDTFLSTAATRDRADAKCEACHADVAARPHHPLQNFHEVGSCGSCHQDHRGRDADMLRVADRTCTHCHADIAAHRLSAAEAPPVAPSPVVEPVTGFAAGSHPPFRGLASDPGTLKFSHGRHMLAGLSFAPDAAPGQPQRGTVWTYAMIPEAHRARYKPAGESAEALVQLDCASCHEFSPAGTDDLRTVSTLLTGAPPGAYPLPLEFERHCAACHQLPLAGTPGGDEAAPAARAPETVLPHGLSGAELRRFLESTLLGEALRRDPALLELPAATPPLPSIREADPAAVALGELVGERLARTQSFARATCEKCHDLVERDLPTATSLLPGRAGRPRTDAGWFDVAPTAVPAIWLPKSRFNHQPHRNLPHALDRHECQDCHAAAFPDETTRAEGIAGRALDNPKVMIAGLESCTTCHAPAGRDAQGHSVGGVRHDCVECHGYHGLGPHGSAAAPALALPER